MWFVILGGLHWGVGFEEQVLDGWMDGSMDGWDGMGFGYARLGGVCLATGLSGGSMSKKVKERPLPE